MQSNEIDCTSDVSKSEEPDAGSKKFNYSNNCFKPDRSCIPTLPRNEQAAELSGLDTEVYSQEVLEKEILQQVDKALKAQTWKQNEKLLPAYKLKKKKKYNLNAEEDGEEHESKDFCGTEHEEQEESEKEKKIRMGEMTPFGTTISLKTIEGNHLENIEKYLEKQVKIINTKKSPKSKSCSSINKAVVKGEATKNKRKVVLRNTISKKRKISNKILDDTISDNATDCDAETSDIKENKILINENSSGSEYIPSASDEDDAEFHCKSKTLKSKTLKRKLHSKKNDEDTADNDSEFECSTGKVKVEKDDGNHDNYLRRLENWEKENSREEIETQLENLGDGFKMPSIIWKKLYNYQKIGVQWLWELNIQKCGGIVGDEMGLGKTIQIIAFFAGLSMSKLLSRHGNFRGLGPVLIVCPTTVMHQWVTEFHQWWPQFRVSLLHESGTYNGKKNDLIREVVKVNGILITSYVTCAQQSAHLLRYTWHYVVLDEGHKIRNPNSQITAVVKLFKTPHRLILSGSPIQNNLKELWSLFDFIFPGKLGTLPVFLAEFGVPIMQGGFANASKVQVATAYKCATVLRDTISPYLLRRVKEDVKNYINLPPKNEQVLFCKLTDEQKHLYIDYLNSERVNEILCGKLRVFVGLIELRKICNHPHLYTGGPRRSKLDIEKFVAEDEKFGFWKKAGKMIVLETLLKIWKKQGHRVLVFTQSRKMLTILEDFVRSQKYEYIKIDGSTTICSRQPLINTFNENKKYYVFLSTTRVGGLGVNLTGANRVVIYDPDWNPATDTQARERAWRLGQENQVTIYRLVTSGTIEEKIYHRQIYKQFLTNKVLKDPSQRRFFKSNDLYELFTFKGDDGTNETSAIFAGTDYELNLENFSKRKRREKFKDKSVMEPECVKSAVEIQNILSKEKIEKMKQLAQTLSRKIAMDALKHGQNEKSEDVSNLDDVKKLGNDQGVKLNEESSAEYKSSKHRKKSKKSKRKKHEYEYMEGEVVPHLQGKKQYRDVIKEASNHEKNDDYILKKLFSKSGVQSALKHDNLMETGSADYALIEGEAEKIAKDAVKALKESRRQYFAGFGDNQPSNNMSKPRFGKKTFGQPIYSNDKINNIEKDNKRMSSAELLIRIRQRNGLTSSFSKSPADDNSELLADIRNFISYGADEENRATTQEIIDKFKDRLPTGHTPIFKALLNEICEFHRTFRGEGVWQLRQDFRW